MIMGLPNSGKTTLAKQLAERLDAAHWNADEVRKVFGAQEDFTLEGRIKQARRMRHLCEVSEKSGRVAIADFVCPTESTREAFGKAFTIWVDRIKPEESRYADTRELFVAPSKYDIRYTQDMSVEDIILKL